MLIKNLILLTSPLLVAQPAPSPLVIPSSLVSKSIAISGYEDKSLYSFGHDQMLFLNVIDNCKLVI